MTRAKIVPRDGGLFSADYSQGVSTRRELKMANVLCFFRLSFAFAICFDIFQEKTTVIKCERM